MSNDRGYNGDDESQSQSPVRSNGGLTEILTEILVEEGDGDLLLIQRSDGGDDNDSSSTSSGVLQWLQALDMQVMGACRADERLKPLLKFNVSSTTGLIAAEDYGLLAHLTQHFEPMEVGMLARCFCIPLVSIRVGKINKQGTLLCPTSVRGNLTLSVLPTSDLRLSFIGDDGHTERLFSLSTKSQCSAVSIDEIPADTSGRSFSIKMPNSKAFYFWCSEKSKLLGNELLSKMRDLLMKKPSIAELTGISEARLGYFATHLRAHLLGSAVSSNQSNSKDASGSSSDSNLNTSAAQHLSSSSKSPRSAPLRNANGLFQGSLSPRPNSFKECAPKTLSSLRNVAREKLKRRADSHLSLVDTLSGTPSVTTEAISRPDDLKLADVISRAFPENFGKLSVPLSENFGKFSPYYCWCPPGVSTTLQNISAPLQLPTSIGNLPILPSNLNLAGPTFLTPNPPFNLADINIPPLDFPPLFPGLSIPSSQQIATFTPLMCDPIVHIPVIDVCSSGQGYLVSAGPAIPSLHPNLNPLLPETDLEKGARETLRMLLSGSSSMSQSNSPLFDSLPRVFTSNNEQQNIFVAGSRGLYSGTTDVNVIANRFSTMDFVTLSRASRVDERCLEGTLEGGGEYCSESEDPRMTSLEEDRSEK
ncbi:hypothetical protein ACFE04_029482 [Oxalis oulophora]